MDSSIFVNYYKIDDKDYIIINELDYKNKHYVYLVNEENVKDILIRYAVDDVLYPVDTEEELKEVLRLLTEKM